MRGEVGVSKTRPSKGSSSTVDLITPSNAHSQRTGIVLYATHFFIVSLCGLFPHPIPEDRAHGELKFLGKASNAWVLQ